MLDDIQKKVTVSMQDATLERILMEINRQTGLDYGFQSNGRVDKNRTFSIDVKDVTVEEALKTLLKGSPYDYVLSNNRVVIIARNIQSADGVEVSGYVYDEQRQPMPGVTVQVMGTTVGTATNEQGRFSIALPVVTGKLRFSFVGYQSQEVTFTEKTDTLRVYMKEDVSDLDEVVVRAYGQQKKREVISAISRVTADEIKELPTASLVNLLQGRMAGVMVVNQSGAPGSAQMVAIRGYNSLMTDGASDGQPLYVIDGVPMHSFVSPVSGTNTMADGVGDEHDGGYRPGDD